MQSLTRILASGVIALGMVLAAEAQTTQTYQIGTGTNIATAINDNGQVVGYRTDFGGDLHSWFLSNGNVSTVDYPAPCCPTTYPSQATGINKLGQIVGNYQDRSTVIHGYLDSGGVFTTIDYPGAEGTFPQGINDSGTIVGWYTDGLDNFFAFEKIGSTFTTIGPPGSEAFAYGINKQGVIVGGYFNGDCSYVECGFLYDGHTYTQIVPPDAGTTGATATGINSVGIVTGSYTPSGGSDTAEDGFLFNRGTQTYTRIDFPGQVGTTEIWGINKKGAYVGVGGLLTLTPSIAYIVRP